MFTAVGIGVLVGRFLFAYLFVLFIFLLFSRFKLKPAFARLHSLKGSLAVLGALVLPILAMLGQRV